MPKLAATRVYVSAAAQTVAARLSAGWIIMAVCAGTTNWAGVTGMLLYVMALSSRRWKDPMPTSRKRWRASNGDYAHTRIIILTDEPVTERGFWRLVQRGLEMCL